jgi:hypothetical protein
MIKSWRSRVARLGLAAVVLFVAYAALLCTPQPFFAYSVRAGNIIVYSDRPLPEGATRKVLRSSLERLAKCPLYAAHPSANVFICNSRWREALFFNKHYGVGGVSPYPFTTNVFLRAASFEENRLISPRGVAVAAPRTLDYYIAHELTHELTGCLVGPWRFYRMPQWIREGYADYVGKGDSFRYEEARQAFLSGVPEMDFQRSGLYWRFHLLVSYLLDHHDWSVERLLRGPWPEQSRLEAEIRAGR